MRSSEAAASAPSTSKRWGPLKRGAQMLGVEVYAKAMVDYCGGEVRAGEVVGGCADWV